MLFMCRFYCTSGDAQYIGTLSVAYCIFNSLSYFPILHFYTVTAHYDVVMAKFMYSIKAIHFSF